MKEDFEKQWSDALGNYSVPPPENTWENIEAQLDKKSKKRGLILWWINPRLVSGIAAALVLTLGYIFYTRLPENKQGNAVLTVQDDKGSVKQPALKNAGEEPKSTENQQTAGATNNTNLAMAGNGILQNKKSNVTNIFKNEVLKNNEPEIFAGKSTESVAMVSTQLPEEISNEGPENYNIAVNKLDSKKARIYANRFVTKRNLLTYEMPEEEETIARTSDKTGKMWLGLNSGAAPFNPNYSYSGFTGEALSSAKNDEAYQSIKDGNVQTSFLPSGTGNTGKYSQNNVMPENSFKNGQSLNFGLNIGKSFSKNLGIESGLRYMLANTSMNSNVFAINPKNGEVSSYFQANYLSANNADYQTVLSLSETSRQYYNYLAVPVVLNYSIPLIKYLKAEALGGVSNDLFLKSRFESDATGSQRLNASNSNYKFYNLSALGGARLNYQVMNNWALTLGGMYQHALFSGVGESTNLNFRPRSFGVNYGLRYQFKK